jgi:hypothetical protein
MQMHEVAKWGRWPVYTTPDSLFMNKTAAARRKNA